MHGSNMEAVYKHIPQKMLPTEFGGTAGTMKELNGMKPPILFMTKLHLSTSLRFLAQIC
jgi:hypothetical protein